MAATKETEPESNVDVTLGVEKFFVIYDANRLVQFDMGTTSVGSMKTDTEWGQVRRCMGC